MKYNMRNKIVILLLISLLWAHFVNAQTIQSDSIRLNQIDSTLRDYGKQQTIANKITLVSIVTIIGGTALGIPAAPLLIVNTIADLTTIIVSAKANKRLSKHAKNKEYR